MDALLGDYRTASAQDTQTQAAIAGTLLAYRTGPDQDVFTTLTLVAYRSAADQDTTAFIIAAALLSYYTFAQVDGLLASKLGVAEAALALRALSGCPARAALGRLRLPAHVGLQRLEGHGLRHVEVAALQVGTASVGPSR